MQAKAKITILQNCIFGFDVFDQDLFSNVKQGCSITQNGIFFSADGEVDLDTIFNSLFLSPWIDRTSLRTIDLEIDYTGDIEISALLHDGDRCDVLLTERLPSRESDHCGVHSIPLAELHSERLQRGGRISLIIAGRAGAKVIGVRFVTSQAPDHAVRLSLGICSFNRPENTAAVLRSLSKGANSKLTTLIIVEQGERVLDETAVNDAALSEHLEIVWLRQDNFGGAGGFTRSICEALHRADTLENGPTHHIMMDDDAIAHPDQWARLAAFFAYSRDNSAIGGPMLELETPWRLHEAGVVFPDNRRRLSLGRGLDVRQRNTLELLQSGPQIEAHGWWCWGAPISAYKLGGAPLNLFIKYDDIEYTYRLKKIGVTTTVLPGAAVWHEAFSHKPADWRVYYTLRNEAIFQALHNPTRAWRFSPVWNSVLPPILRDEPVSAHLAIDAINDFMRGPSHALPTNPALFHNKVMARFDALRAEHDPPSRPNAPRAHVSNWLRDWQTARARVSLFARVIACQIRFLAFRRQAQAAWRAHLLSEPGRGRHASWAAWQRLFKCDGGQRSR